MRMEYEDTFDEFNEMVTQFGYLALFAPAYALAPICSLINNIFEIRIDGDKFCHVYRRPQWRPCPNIGAWYAVLNVVGFVAVLTNATMIAFVGTQLSQDSRCTCKSASVDTLAETMCSVSEVAANDTSAASPLDSYFGPATCVQSCWEQEGIWNRVLVQRLWTVMLLIEHGVLVCRMIIIKVEPEVPEWLTPARTTLNFRIGQWQKAAKYMRKQGLDTDEIQHRMWQDEVDKIEKAGGASPCSNSRSPTASPTPEASPKVPRGKGGPDISFENPLTTE